MCIFFLFKAQSSLAARGAQIFKIIIQRRVKKERQKEAKEFNKLKARVDGIREKRLKLNESRGISEEPKTYYEGELLILIYYTYLKA